MVSAETLSINLGVYPSLPYDVRTNFSPVSPLVKLQHVLAARRNWPADGLRDSTKLVRDNPGQFSYGTWGVGSVPHVGMEMLLGALDLKSLHVPFNGGPSAFNGLMAGEIDLMIMPLFAAKPFKDTGKIKVLGIAADARSALLADVATLKEQGLDLQIDNTVGLAAPAATPPAVVQKLNAEIAKVLADPEVRARLTTLGSQIFQLSSTEYSKYIDSE